MLFIITGLCDDDVLHKLASYGLGRCVCVWGGDDGGSGGIRIGTQKESKYICIIGPTPIYMVP